MAPRAARPWPRDRRGSPGRDWLPASDPSPRRHLEARIGGRKSQFVLVALAGGDPVGAEAAVLDGVQVEILIAGLVRINDGLPRAIEARALAGGVFWIVSICWARDAATASANKTTTEFRMRYP
jgi:hypothetical protein